MNFGEALAYMLRGYTVRRAVWKDKDKSIMLSYYGRSPSVTFTASRRPWLGMSHDYGAVDWEAPGADPAEEV